ncbi:MAG TPA: fibronectin type III domain-containing protein, partial [Kiritimatiellia bacterium]
MRRTIVAVFLAALGVAAAPGTAGAVPPSTPVITGIVNNTGSVWSNGFLVTNYVKKGDYRVRWSASTHATGIKNYHLQEARNAGFTVGTQTWFLGGDFITSRLYQFFLKTNGTNFYRVRAEATNGELSAWSAVSNKRIQMAGPFPPPAPQITRVHKNVKQDVWKNGSLVTGYVHQGDFIVCLSTSAAGEGVDFYEIEETTGSATNFATNLNVTGYLPHYPDTNSFMPGTTTLHTNPVKQFFLKTNATYYYRARAVDRNGFRGPWNVSVVTNWGAYSNVNVTMTNYPPSPPALRKLERNVRQNVWVNGVLVTNYLHAADFAVHASIASSGAGVNFYEIQETTASATNFLLGANLATTLPHYPDTNSFLPGTTIPNTNPVAQFFLKTNATYFYRLRAVDINGFTSGWNVVAVTNWGAYSNIAVSVTGQVPPTVPAIRKLERNIRGAVWINGVLNTNYLHAADYAINLSIASSGPGVNFYEIQEATNATHFAAGLGSVFSLPHYPNTNEYLPGTSILYTNPVGQAYLKPNGTFYYRVRAVDINGFTSGWNVVAVTNVSAYSNITVSMPGPYPPSVPQIRSISNNIREDIWVNGILVSNYLHAADYVINMSTSASGAGVNFYEVQKVTDLNGFVTGQGIALDLPHYPDTNAFMPGSPILYTNPVSQSYQVSNGTHYYRVRAVDINGFTSGWNVASVTNWSAYSNRVINLPPPVPPTTPLITSIRPDVVRTVFSNGVPLVYTTKSDYVVNISTSAAGSGVSIYEVQETTNPANFQIVDTSGYPLAWFAMSNPPVRIIAPHFPDPDLFMPGTTQNFTNPAVQFFTKPNGTYYYRVCAHDINGFRSAWNVAYSPTSVYPSYVVNVLQPSPPIPPAVATNSIQNLDGSLIVSFPASVSGEPILGYEIELSTDPTFATTNAATYSLVPSAVFDGLPVGTYYIRVRAEDWNGIKSGWSTVQGFTFTMPIIAGVSISQVSNDSAVVTWTTDVPSSTEVERRGMYKVFQSWRDPATFVQGVLYAPAEAYGDAITTNDVETDLQQFKTNNINLINLYNLGWGELQENGNVEDYIFKRAGELGIKIVVRLETYNKYHDTQPIGGDNTPEKHYAYRPEDADWIINYYTVNTPVFGTNGYLARYPNAVKYIVINMPFDDPELRRQDGIGLNDFPDKDRQRSYIAAFVSKIKAVDPVHDVYVNLGFGGQDRDPHFGVADLADGISEHVYTVRLDYYTRCYGYIPGAQD